MAGTKGISPLVGFVLAILLAVIVVAAVSALVYSFYTTVSQDEIKRELTQAAAQTTSKITELYSLSKQSKATPPNSTGILIASIRLNLPDKVASKGYSVAILSANEVTTLLSNVSFNNQSANLTKTSQTGKVVAQTTEEPAVTVEYDVPSIDVDMQGKSTNPLNATLRYYRYNPNGTLLDTILLGDYTLLGQVTAVS